jgi:polyphosphate glucokinase
MTDAALTLAIDIGGSHLKAGVLNLSGGMVAGPVRVDTPHPGGPDAVVPALGALVKQLGPFDRISVGFPGVVRKGVVLTAPNLGSAEWHGFALAARLSEAFGKPARLSNDASVQALGVIAGRGVECVITLGTGMGFALFRDGRMAPHLELGQHPVRSDRTYDQYVGAAALKSAGPKRWNKRVRRAIGFISTLTAFEALYVGGGNAKLLDAKALDDKVPSQVKIVSNEAGITGGVRLWDAQHDDDFD